MGEGDSGRERERKREKERKKERESDEEVGVRKGVETERKKDGVSVRGGK